MAHLGTLVLLLLLTPPQPPAGAGPQAPIPNPAIDMEAHLRLSREAAALREPHRLTESDFIRMAGEPGTVILDARSKAMYDLRHVQGAVNLSFPDFTAESLAGVIPAKSTRILIYCNNNSLNDSRAFALKAPAASLNLSTYTTLYVYGYRNVYELGPMLDVRTTRIQLVPAP